MAEQVQEALDQMVAPLRDLMDRQIFTESEVKAIVSRRRESEYLLRRRAARKADFLRYLEAEQLLEELRRIRTEQRKRDHRKSQQPNDDDEDADSDDENNNNGNKNKKEEQHIGDIHIMQHIHLLFVRAIRKFRSDLSLHLLHVDFCKKYSSWTRLGKVYAEALQIFPRKAGLWIEAASHEFFGARRSIRSARILMQRGLRILPHSQDMWVEYFSLELHYAQTLKGRRQILLKGHGRQEMEEVKEEKDKDAPVDNQDYKIAEIVYKNAIKAIPDSIPFRLRFLDTCRRFPDTQNLMNSIQEPLQQDFRTQPEAWIARAYHKMQEALAIAEEEEVNRPKKKAKTKDPVVEVLEEGVATVASEEMNLQSFRFAQRYLDEQEKLGNEDSVVQTQELINQILKQSAEEVESPDLALEQAEYYISRGEDEMAVLVFEAFCAGMSGGKPKAVAPGSLWIRYASLYSDDKVEGTRILKKGLDRIPLDRKDHLDVLLQCFGCLLHRDEPDRRLLNDAFQRILLLAPTGWDVVVEDVSDYWFGIESVAHAYLEYLKCTETLFGLKAARNVYNTILFQSTVQIKETTVDYLTAFMDKSLALEKSNRIQQRRLYDQIIQILTGTPLETKYRQERNDSSIYQ